MAKIQFSIFCEGFKNNSETKLYSIDNAFERILLPEFPGKCKFALLIYWIGEPEEIHKPPVTATILDQNGDKLMGSSFVQMNIPYESYNISFCVFQDLTFVSPWTYFANIEINGITINTIPIPVNKL